MLSIIYAGNNQGRPCTQLEDLQATPEVFIFSSNKAYANYKFRKCHATLFRVLRLIWEVVKAIFRIICLPLGLYWVLEKVCQNACTPSAGGIITEPLCEVKKQVQQSFAKKARRLLQQKCVKTIKRIPIQCDNLLIDTLAITFPNAKPDRWMIFAPGQAECFEHRVLSNWNWAQDIAAEAQSNFLMMNYPGVMQSQGEVSLESLIKAHAACVAYLRDYPEGPQAKEIIAYGYSLGTAVQSAALAREVTDGSDGVHWMVIQDRAPRSLAAVAKQLAGIFGEWGIKWTGWNVDIESASKTLPTALLIHNCTFEGEVLGDGVFSRNTCLASALLDTNSVENKIFIGVPCLYHANNLPSEEISRVAGEIVKHFDKAPTEKEEL